jgi:HD-GYP domain-containing protein (c-di-GMP phosphodiesterase class II)
LEAIKLNKLVDEELQQHHEKVAELSFLISKEMQLDNNVCNKIYAAALEHDLGKIFLNQEVLNKPRKLNKKEYEYIKNHVLLSVSYLNSKKTDIDTVKYVLYHHENYDGTGYPVGLKGSKIPLGARILRIADTFAALTVDRVYRKKLSIKKALSIMDSEKKFYDLEIYSLFKKIIKNKEVL